MGMLQASDKGHGEPRHALLGGMALSRCSREELTTCGVSLRLSNVLKNQRNLLMAGPSSECQALTTEKHLKCLLAPTESYPSLQPAPPPVFPSQDMASSASQPVVCHPSPTHDQPTTQSGSFHTQYLLHPVPYTVINLISPTSLLTCTNAELSTGTPSSHSCPQ